MRRFDLSIKMVGSGWLAMEVCAGGTPQYPLEAKNPVPRIM